MAFKALIKLKDPIINPADQSEVDSLLVNPAYIDGTLPVFQPSAVVRNIPTNPMIELGEITSGINFAVNINNIDYVWYDTTDGALTTALSSWNHQGYLDLT